MGVLADELVFWPMYGYLSICIAICADEWGLLFRTGKAYYSSGYGASRSVSGRSGV